jgi:hypothetical protein
VTHPLFFSIWRFAKVFEELGDDGDCNELFVCGL